MPKLKKNGDGYGCGYETTTPNIELRMTNGFERQNANVALNAKLERGGGSEHRKWEKMVALSVKQKVNNDSERQNEQMALNSKLKKYEGIECLGEYKKWLWTPRLKALVALNAKAERQWWLWTLNGKCRWL